ncbi:MAG: HpcH/HpaI aldolase family protein [Inquilinaceae bacterium]
MTAPGLKRMTGNRSLKLGHFVVEFATPGIGHILKAAGCDFALVDTEHSGFGIETIKSVVRYMEAADLPTIVRVPSRDYHDIARIADVGAEGLMLPMVGTAADARAILNSMKYTPLGNRGVALQVAHDNYRPGPVADKLDAANSRTTLFALIETAEGVANVDAIAAIDGVDCLWIGHFDLSSSMGIPGRFDHPDFIGAVDAVAAAARRHGKSLGRLVQTVEDGIALSRAGFDFLCYSGDVWALQAAVKDGVDRIRNGAKAGSKNAAKSLGKTKKRSGATAATRKAPAKSRKKKAAVR